MDARVAWLRAVLDEDEATAKAAGGDSGDLSIFEVSALTDWEGTGLPEEEALHIARHDPRQVLARVEAERAVLDLWEFARLSPHSEAYGVLSEAMRALVSGYRHRPGYNPAWDPTTP